MNKDNSIDDCIGEEAAKIVPRSEQKRTILADVIPLDTPFVLGIWVGDVCNFRCKYCIQSVEPRKDDGLVRKFLDWDTFLKIAEQASQFPHKIKKILFCGIGESTLHSKLAEMIDYLNKLDVADEYELVSNGSLLTPELSKKLIDAGLTRLCLSIQGVTTERYREVCNVSMDINVLCENIKFFYEYSRGKCRIHLKTVNIALHNEKEKEKFYHLFSSICDTIYIDNVVAVFKGVDYTDMVDESYNVFGKKRQESNVICCPTIFYTLYTQSDGGVVPCCNPPFPKIYGNIKENTLVAIWNGKVRYDFLNFHLQKKRLDHPICKNCITPKMVEYSEDKLDFNLKDILNKLNISK